MHKTVVYLTIYWMQTWIDIKLLLIEFHEGVAAEGGVPDEECLEVVGRGLTSLRRLTLRKEVLTTI